MDSLVCMLENVLNSEQELSVTNQQITYLRSFEFKSLVFQISTALSEIK